MTDVPAVRTAYLVKRLELAVRAHLDAVVRPHGLTTAQYTALTALRVAPEQSSAQLARRSFVSAQTMQELVAGLERRGLVTRSPAPANRRVLRVRLTERGEDVLAELDRGMDELEREMLADLDAAQVQALRDALRLCTRRLTAARSGER
ncbi:MarR family winged helix-turn-helix transcriptional regulator [Prauserella muralis]|uniref:MarR family transcriptional regulator n=1 Tax=Prauserella muralis TaxID=588067 RepID=A0A2V4B8W6_9PSEU|nr:MarR family transcriptional regulator [Prauserella muralis]PXY31606.1 MarR family transcriptional regulator [Prauserella muralis]TWE14031.1 DNA-binding MarR family transcriptional regulator [Prauserella muralis]